MENTKKINRRKIYIVLMTKLKKSFSRLPTNIGECIMVQLLMLYIPYRQAFATVTIK